MEDILKAPAERERAWLTRHGAPRLPREPLNHEVYDHKKVDPRAQIESLSEYLDLVPWLVPEDEDLHRPVMRHPDLSPNNIFISDGGSITGLIDWQHCAIMPFSLHSRIPEHFQNWGDEDSESFHLPALPANYHDLTAPEKDLEDEKYRRRQLHHFYVGFTGLHNKKHSKALRDSSITEANKLFEIAGHPWEGDNASLRAQIIRYNRFRSLRTKYSEAEEQWALDADEQQKDSANLMQTFRNHIGCNIENWIPAEDHESAMQKARDLKAQVLANAETNADRELIDRDWPFQDYEEID